MKQQLLFSPSDLHEALKKGLCTVVDCRFALTDPAAGYRDFLEGHIPGAVYAHLDDDLSSPVTANTGRHPLPDQNAFATFLARSGWQAGKTLVAYDSAGGAIAARLWWLMKYFGHDCAALLDGGFAAWQSAGYELESGPATSVATNPIELVARDELVMSTVEIPAYLQGQKNVLVDVRAAERYRGELEPLDTVAGHIPGAVNYPLQQNLSKNGSFKSAQQIRDDMSVLSKDRQVSKFVYMCGSGVTACHAIFAAELAGLQESVLYAGSWSEWIRDPSRPVESVQS